MRAVTPSFILKKYQVVSNHITDGQICINIFNHNDRNIQIRKGDLIATLIAQEVHHVNSVEVTYE